MIFIWFLMVLHLAWPANFVRSLKDAETVDFDSFYRKPIVAIVFQTGCGACRKQIRDLKCLEERYRIVLLGAFSSEESLKDEYMKMKSPYPGFYASPDILKLLNLSSLATPLVIDFSRTPISVHLGYKKCEELKVMYSSVFE